MNEQLLSIIAAKADYPVTKDDQSVVASFCEYMDHNSLWLLRCEHSDDPKFIFTNDAQHFTFTLSEIKEHYRKMKSGIAMDWENIPFEYISKG
ncbi:MAG: hypothetical protein WCH46_00390 [bacterium]